VEFSKKPAALIKRYRLSLLFVSVFSILLVVSNASALTQTVFPTPDSASVPYTMYPSGALLNVEVPQFDPILGALLSVEIEAGFEPTTFGL